MSSRSEAAAKVADFVSEHSLDRVFGGDAGYGDGKKYRTVLFDIPRLLDGEVRIYNTKFVLVLSAGPSGDGREAFGSVDDALAYMKARWVDSDIEAADAVPRKEKKS